MEKHCFGLYTGSKRHTYCQCMKGPKCPGYDKCPFYKPKWQNDAEIAKYGKKAQPADSKAPYSTLQKLEMQKMRDEGATLWEVAKEMGCSTTTVSKWTSGRRG